MSDMNFLPEDYLEKRAQHRTNAISLALFVVVMGAIVGAFFWTDRQRTDVRELRTSVDHQFEVAAKRLEQLDQLQARKHMMTEKAKVTASLLERVPRTLILSELINRMPAEVGLLELSLDTKQLTKRNTTAKSALDKAKEDLKKKGAAAPIQPIVDIPETDVTLKMVGVAPTDVDVAKFMSELGVSPLFVDLNLEFSQEDKVGNQPVRKFQVFMRLNQDVDLEQFKPTMVKRDLKRNPMSETVQFNAPDGGTLPPPPPNNPNVKPASNGK